ncbi:hypothetical protein TNCV_4801591 [Trichonephila clavipes]|nr:hypothetical protein TNCV_4801591 [Trichonephila clavipes]
MKGNTLPRVSMAERSKALRSGRSPLLWAWAGQVVKGSAFMSKSTRFWGVGWPSGQRFCVHVEVHSVLGRGLRFLSGLKRCVRVAEKCCRRGFGFHV